MKNNEVSAIELFSNCCELLNTYELELAERWKPIDVKSGADIRKYNCGWRLEKYLEANISPEEGNIATWWIELGYIEGRWVVSSNVNISHTEIYIELPDMYSENIIDLKSSLEESVALLQSMTESDNPFSDEINKKRRKWKT